MYLKSPRDSLLRKYKMVGLHTTQSDILITDFSKNVTLYNAVLQWYFYVRKHRYRYTFTISIISWQWNGQGCTATFQMVHIYCVLSISLIFNSWGKLATNWQNFSRPNFGYWWTPSSYPLGCNWQKDMMTSSNRNIFCIIGPLCRQLPVTCEFPSQRPVTWSFDFSLICTWTNGWVNNHDAGDLRCHCSHFDITVRHH